MTYHPLLKGAIELHVHSSPSLFPRKQTDWELIEDVKSAKMDGIVIKSHEAQTVDRTFLIREKEPSLHVYGGLALNECNGGFSPAAVEMALKLGGKIIWMPTISAAQHHRYYSKTSNNKGLEVLDAYGKVLSEVHEILSLISEHDAILATGHLAPHEVNVLVNEAKEKNVQKILIQHSDLGIARIPFEMEKDLVRKGCILEKCYLACSDDFQDISVEDMAKSIQLLGEDACVLVTDYGQAHNPPAIEALSNFVCHLIKTGVKEKQIEKMIQFNPKALLGI